MENFKQLQASALYCPRCREAVPVQERLLLLLPDGKLFEYRCTYCAASVGTRREKATEEKPLILLP